ncbi:IclR family transcriptional regulator [Streptomyces sp. NPDC002133]|uniref:IclR family transcriptional regulator n=1 Tax=Streptomyces sp. NPDC002133 TaxID=3154409 RepID=UPI00331A1527
MSGVQSVARAMAVLEKLSLSGTAGVNELARELELAPSTVQRLLGALSEAGVVEQDPADRSYRVGLRLFQWGQTPLRRLRLRELAKPHMQELAVEVGETIALGVLDGAHVMHVEWIPARHLVQPRIGIGDRTPALSSSMGQCLIAWLPRQQRIDIAMESAAAAGSPGDPAVIEEVLATVRAQGFAIVADPQANVRTIAVPVRAGIEQAVGALGIGGPSTRFPADRATSIAPRLIEVGAAISNYYGTLLATPHDREWSLDGRGS